MAVTAIPVNSEMILVLDNGINPETGNQLLSTRRYTGVKNAAANEDIYSVAQSLVGLQQKDLEAIQRRTLVVLESE